MAWCERERRQSRIDTATDHHVGKGDACCQNLDSHLAFTWLRKRVFHYLERICWLPETREDHMTIFHRILLLRLKNGSGVVVLFSSSWRVRATSSICSSSRGVFSLTAQRN